LVIIAVINTAIAVYYYLSVVREAWFKDPGNLPPIQLDWSTKLLCVLLIGGILGLGIAPARILGGISRSVAQMHNPSAGAVTAIAAHSLDNHVLPSAGELVGLARAEAANR